MFTKNLTKKKAIILLIILGAVLAAAVMCRSLPGSGFGLAETIDVSTVNGRVKYLKSYGWNIDEKSEQYQTVVLPKKFDTVMEQYADMQYQQGFCLYDYAGFDCKQYTYTVTNYDSESPVYATLYVWNRRVIAADIHSAKLDGFMHGIKTKH